MLLNSCDFRREQFRAYLYSQNGEFRTEEQIRFNRLEVFEGGIAHVKQLIANGEQQEGHFQELLVEKAQLEAKGEKSRMDVPGSEPQNVRASCRRAPEQNASADCLAVENRSAVW